jgi:putative membrane protein
MIKRQMLSFAFRWLVSSLAMFICIRFFASFPPEYEGVRSNIWLYIVAGLIFSLVNTVIKPIVTIFALPLISITYGLATVLVNTAMVGLTVWIMPEIQMTLLGAIESCLLISLINYLVNLAMSDVK